MFALAVGEEIVQLRQDEHVARHLARERTSNERRLVEGVEKTLQPASRVAADCAEVLSVDMHRTAVVRIAPHANRPARSRGDALCDGLLHESDRDDVVAPRFVEIARTPHRVHVQRE
ncbi:MAG: hypothetical protein NTU83_02075, partial [Candidatus Hydrogenedentes bacterium]|nr:hypothetical protein [Candidatus Hydrogenedentota bacterium]